MLSVNPDKLYLLDVGCSIAKLGPTRKDNILVTVDQLAMKTVFMRRDEVVDSPTK